MGRTAHGLDKDPGAARPASVTDRLSDDEDLTPSVAEHACAILSAQTSAQRTAAWAAVPAPMLDAVATAVTGIPSAPAHYAVPECRPNSGGSFVSLDTLTPDTMDALCDPLWDVNGRPGVYGSRPVADLLRESWDDVRDGLDAGTRVVASAWLTVPEAVTRGCVNRTAVARAAGLVSPDTRRAPIATRDAVDRIIRDVTDRVADRAACIMAEDETRTLGGVRDIERHTMSADRLTPSQRYRIAYARDYAASWRDMRPSARDLTGGFPWAGETTHAVAPIPEDVRASLYGERAEMSQAAQRERATAQGLAPRPQVVRSEYVPSVAPLTTDAPDAPVSVAPATGRATLLARFGARA
jgi:hypothetical protein